MKIPLVAAGVLLLVCVSGAADVPVNEVTRQRVLSAPEWQESYDSYNPEAAAVEALKSKIGDDLRIDVYLGLWCSDSRNHVPPFIKILETAGVPVPVRFLNVQRKPVKTIRYFSDKDQVERVPTFIFYRGGIEIGRIVENPKIGLIEDMIAVL